MPQPDRSHWPNYFKFFAQFGEEVGKRLVDIDLRIATMDRSGIAAQVISLGEPGCQGYTDLKDQIEFAHSANDFIYKNYIQAHPTRFFGLACIPSQEGKAAAAELERTVKEFGFKG